MSQNHKSKNWRKRREILEIIKLILEIIETIIENKFLYKKFPKELYFIIKC
jgi:hypothetical protein